MIYTLPEASAILAQLIAEGQMGDPANVTVETRPADDLLLVTIGPWTGRWVLSTGTFIDSGSNVTP